MAFTPIKHYIDLIDIKKPCSDAATSEQDIEKIISIKPEKNLSEDNSITLKYGVQVSDDLPNEEEKGLQENTGCVLTQISSALNILHSLKSAQKAVGILDGQIEMGDNA